MEIHTCDTCGHTDDDRAYFSYENWSAGTHWVCECCLEAYEMTRQEQLRVATSN